MQSRTGDGGIRIGTIVPIDLHPVRTVLHEPAVAGVEHQRSPGTIGVGVGPVAGAVVGFDPEKGRARRPTGIEVVVEALGQFDIPEDQRAGFPHRRPIGTEGDRRMVDLPAPSRGHLDPMPIAADRARAR